ncbi:transcriptional regulator, LysR family [Amycolatopsis marina]|uniref:Transcriptional regulator, LysR family n=1 Tax=Amycolatopsis marina TaxID=490629 RepID=A0A1I0XWP1_9PSEU|nr:LysR family transcriptional regulator [Amycolatopsis marina]SFB05421.1 transcriptional regulator, LysR family [Amycolatopsis marina]
MAEVDLNLLKTFVLLYETRSVTRTAESLFITQPSVSHALRRLRRQFNDELFLRSANGLVATETAAGIYPRLNQALEVINETVRGVGQFDPTTSERTFRLLATDLGEIALLPDVLATIGNLAPHSTVQVIPLDFSTAAEELRQGHADAVICTPRIDSADLQRDPLFRGNYLGLCARTHPRIRSRPTLEEYLAERHILVDAAAGHVDADRILTRLGHRRDVAARVPHFAVLPELVARTGYLGVVPSGVADLFTQRSDVRTFALPFEVPEVEVALYTYRRALPSPGIEWLRGTVASVLRQDEPA